MVRDEALQQWLKVEDRQALYDNYQGLFTQFRETHNITHFYFHRPDRVNLLRVHKPAIHNDLIDRFTALQAERTGRVASGIELGPLGTFILRTVMPVLKDNKLVGYVELGKEIEGALASIHGEYGTECYLAIHKNVLNQAEWEQGMDMLGRKSDWQRKNKHNHVITYSSPLAPDIPSDQFLGTGEHQHNDPVETTFDGKTWYGVAQPLKDDSGAVVGDLILLYDITHIVDD